MRPVHSSLSIGPEGRIVVVADTHSLPHPAMGKRLEEIRPTAILHAGDIGNLQVLDELATYAPVLAVRGNIDAANREIPEQRLIDVGPNLRILLLHIAVNGPRLRAEVVRTAQSLGAHLVVCGHSHVPFIGSDKGVFVFNPGSIGPRRFSLPIVFGSIDWTPTAVKLRHLDCATGDEWRPA